MNLDEQPTRRQPALRLCLPVTVALIMLLGFPNSTLAQNQWATDGNNINSTNTGNVGIGTTAPEGKLDVRMNIGEDLRLFGNGSGTFGRITPAVPNWWGFTNNAYYQSNWFLDDPSRGGSAIVLDNHQATKPIIFLAGWAAGPNPRTTSQWYGLWLDIANQRVGVGTYTPAGLFDVNGKLTVLSTGNVGIGTTTPSYRLHLRGNNTSAGGFPLIKLENTQSGGHSYWLYAGANGVAADFGFYDETTSTYPFYIKGSNGNVGIGTTAPNYKLDVNGIINATAIYQNGSPFSSSQWTSGAGNISYNSGNVGIGVAAPAAKLDVAGQIRSSVGGFKFPDGTVQTTAAGSGGGTISEVAAGTGLTGGGTTGSVTLTNADRGSSQSIFKNIADAAGATQFSAASNNDSLRVEGSGGTSVTFDAVNKKIVINSSTSSSTVSAANVSAGEFGQNTGGGNFNFPGNVTVAGNLAAKYQDIAEWVPANQALSVGTVVVLNPAQSNQVMASTEAYDTRVAGVVSERPGLALGEAGKDKVLVATTGRVKVRVDASLAPIRIGDLLVTSDKQGAAMKSQPLMFQGRVFHSPGTLIGKALEPLEKGTGEILVLLSLQ